MNNEKEFLVQKIRANYVEREYTELDKLRMLDCEVRRSVNVFSYVFGSISAIIMGSGMSLVMTDIGSTLGIENPLVGGTIIGVIGMAMAIFNYPLHKGLLEKRKAKYREKILAMSDSIMNK